MKFQTVKKEETILAEKIFREIVQNSLSNGFYKLLLVEGEKKKKIEIPESYELAEEYPIVVLNKESKMTTWDYPKDNIGIPDNETLYNKYHALKRSIDFVFVNNGHIEWKRDKKIWVNDREGINKFYYGCYIGFELVLTCDVDDSKFSDLKEYDIKPIYKINTLELINLYNQYQKQDALPQYLPVTEIIV